MTLDQAGSCMNRSSRSIISLLMTAIYLLVIMAPLAPAALHPGMLIRVLKSECAGDCRSCGCSPERSAARACCCWQKKLAEAKAVKQSVEHKSCPTSTAATNTKPAGSCCGKAQQHADHDDEASSETQANSTTDKESVMVSISTCPCGSGNDLAFSAGETVQHIPFRYLTGIPFQQISRLSFLQAERLASRSDQPPDPPPKILIAS